MAKVHHRIGVASDPEEVFACLIEADKLAAWWASSAEVGKNLRLEFAGLTTLEFAVVECRLSERLLLRCLGEPDVWAGALLEFRVEATAQQTYLYLTHSKESATDADLLYFNTKWPLFLVSLKDFVETGSGRPYPNDQRIQHD